MATSSWFRDKDFQVHLLSFLCRDRNFLKKCGSLLQAKDFKPGRDESDERHVIATLALEFWNKYKSPIAGMLRVNVVDHCRTKNVGDKKKKALSQLVDQIVKGDKLIAVDAIEDRVLQYLRDKMLKDSVESLVQKREDGELDVDAFVAIGREVAKWSGKNRRTMSDFLGESNLDNRIVRRGHEVNKRRPMLFVDELDVRTKSIGRGDIGLLVAASSKGKSLGLAHIADSYAKQKLNVLYITLEDPIEEVEDRMDASLAYLPIERLPELPNKLKKRFRKFSRLIQGRIKIVDGTDGGVTVQEIDEIWLRLRDEGFTADAIIVDYDKELKAHGKHRERRFEFEEIYTDLRQLAARRQVYLWTAAQAKRLKDTHKIITQDTIGEDIGKVQKVTMMIGIGQGELHQYSRHLFVAKNKRGRAHFGVDIMMDPAKGLFYDRDATAEMNRALKLKKRKAA